MSACRLADERYANECGRIDSDDDDDDDDDDNDDDDDDDDDRGNYNV